MFSSVYTAVSAIPASDGGLVGMGNFVTGQVGSCARDTRCINKDLDDYIRLYWVAFKFGNLSYLNSTFSLATISLTNPRRKNITFSNLRSIQVEP